MALSIISSFQANYMECIEFWLEHDEKHKFQYED